MRSEAFAQQHSREAIRALRRGAAVMAVLALAALAGAASASAALAPGDVAVYRVGTGSAALSSAATPVFLDVFEPGGKLVESIALPTAATAVERPSSTTPSRGT